MIGRQARVRVSKEDRAILEREIRRRSGVLIPYAAEHSELGEVQTIEVPKGVFAPWVVRASDVPYVHRRLVEQQGHWIVDSVLSPVVQWTKVSPDRNGVADYVLYFKPQDVKDGEWVDLPKPFVDWADGLLRWVRRSFRRNPEERIYVGPNAARLFDEGAS